jgi:hypothetical protein
MTSLPVTSLPVTSLSVTSLSVTLHPVAMLLSLTEGYTPPLLTEGYMPPSTQLQQYLQSNEEEPYYILKTNNPGFVWVPDGYDPDHFMPCNLL